MPLVPPSIAALAAPSEDPLRRLWGPVTIRVAWELVRQGIPVRAPTLAAAREHALWRIPPVADLAEAEARAEAAVREFAARRRGDYSPVAPDPDLDLLPAPAWRRDLLAMSNPVHEAIFRLHYADGVPFEDVVRRMGIDPASGRAAREGVRELARMVLSEDGVATEGWPAERLDALIRRLAVASGEVCPGPVGLSSDAGRTHAESCPRCERALRLMREGVLSPTDLFAPEGALCLPPEVVDLVAVLLHPDARKHARALGAALPGAIRYADDAWVVAPQGGIDPDGVEAALAPLAEAGRPPAASLRVLRRGVPGRRLDGVVVGPGIEEFVADARGLAWGEQRGLGPLPAPVPPPPSPVRWWAASILLLVAALGVALGMLAPRHGGATGLEARRAGEGLEFDVADDAWVWVFAADSGRPALVFSSDAVGDKGALSTGDGRFHLAGSASRWVVVASPRPLTDVDRIADAASDADDLAERLRVRYPDADIEPVP